MDDEEILDEDLEKAKKGFIRLIKSLDGKDFIIIILVIMLFIMALLNAHNIDLCNAFYQDILKNMTFIQKSLYNITSLKLTI